MNESNINDIPKAPGNYWILSNEPIVHSFNPDFDKRPKNLKIKEQEFKIIYNGQADNIKNRIKAHLYRPDSKGIGDLSGISIDITSKIPLSHNKCLYHKLPGKKKKMPYYESEKRQIQFKDIKHLYSEDDVEHVRNCRNNVTEESVIYFKNGIDIREKKHKKYTWLVIYYDMNKAIYHPFSDIIEQEWRKLNGSPILCSYKCGR